MQNLFNVKYENLFKHPPHSISSPNPDKSEKTNIIHHEITKVRNHQKGHNKFRAF